MLSANRMTPILKGNILVETDNLIQTNFSSTPSETVNVIYYSNRITDAENLEKNFNFKIVCIPDREKLIRYISQSHPPAHCLSIDAECCENMVGVSVHDYIRMLSTILNLSGNTTSIVIVVGLDISVEKIREFMSVPEVNGIVIKSCEATRDEIEEGMDDLRNKRYHIPRRIKQKLKESKKKKAKPTTDEIVLTPRQTQILNLVLSKGASNKVIGSILKISESTVKLHITSILKKYGLRNRTQLALFAKTKD